MPYKRGNEGPSVAGSLQAAEYIVIRIEAAVGGIVNTAVSIAALENTWSVEQAQLFLMREDCRIAHRN